MKVYVYLHNKNTQVVSCKDIDDAYNITHQIIKQNHGKCLASTLWQDTGTGVKIRYFTVRYGKYEVLLERAQYVGGQNEDMV